MICAVCGTDREGMNNDPIHRRVLKMDGREVNYCADVVECGEAAAMDYLDARSGNSMAQVADEMGPEAVGMIAGYLQRSADERQAIEAGLSAALTRDRDEWQARALAAEDKLWRARTRILALLGLDEL